MENYRDWKAWLGRFRGSPLHPQWFVFRGQATHRRFLAGQAREKILDIGCADQYLRALIARPENYVGLDYYETARLWYGTKPDVYGDAQSLPFAEDSFDTVYLLDVLEHLPEPDRCLQEIARVLASGGRLILQVPFIYPIHDAPLDFRRWTEHGLHQTVASHGFVVRQAKAAGRPLETAGLLFNIALSRVLLDFLETKSPWLVLAPLWPPAILAINLACWVLSRLGKNGDLMPHGYCLVLEKP